MHRNWYPKGTLTKPFEPQKIDAVTAAFPANVGHLMPPVEEIPEEFGYYSDSRSAKKGTPAYWINFQSTWFSRGVDASKIKAKKGVDKDMALRHLSTIQGSFEPKHEYKMAAVAYLASLWLEKWDASSSARGA